MHKFGLILVRLEAVGRDEDEEHCLAGGGDQARAAVLTDTCCAAELTAAWTNGGDLPGLGSVVAT